MTSKFDRFFNPKDGTYANAPIVAIHPEKFRGKRFYNTNVLIGNWYEDRSKMKESKHRSKGSYWIDYPAQPGAAPDLVLRRQLLSCADDRPSRLILDHHDIDNRKQMISSYDEHYHRRGTYGRHQHSPERYWKILEKSWLPERSDHPLEDEPTSWGLVEAKRAQSQCLQRERTMPALSEYSARFVPHRPTSKLVDIPHISSTSIHRSHSLSNEILPRSNSFLGDNDPLEGDHLYSLRRNDIVPRSHFYLGRTQSDRMRDTLPPVTSHSSALE